MPDFQTWEPAVIDMMDPGAPIALTQKACRNFGFFRLKNHGVPNELMEKVFAQSRSFFSLSEKDKMSVLADKNNRGYTPMHEEILEPANQTQGDTKEGYYIFREIEAGSEAAAKPLQGPNQWPSDKLLPGWRETMLRYYETLNSLGIRLSRLLAEGLGLEVGFFESFFVDSLSALRLLHYSTQVSDPGKGVLGTGAHSDYGLLTLLATASQSIRLGDDVPGLQVMLDGAWYDVLPQHGTFICNLGDMLERWTNGYLQSTLHRVVNCLGQERYSIPFFFEPAFETEVICMPQFCSEENPAKYPPTTSGQYLLDKYSQTHTGF
ncbi:unnamed protein product, partial [Choristocarpus tenellus]